MNKDNCTVCGGEILVMAFRGTGFCGVDCKKKAGKDVSSVGTIMFVTTDEAATIKEARNG